MTFLAFFFFLLWRKNWTPAWLVGVHTSALISCDSLAVKSHIWLIIVIINQWDGWAVQGIIAASHCSHSSHLGAPHSTAVLGCSEGVWMMAMMGGALKLISVLHSWKQRREGKPWLSRFRELELSLILAIYVTPQSFKPPGRPAVHFRRGAEVEAGSGRWRKESVLSLKHMYDPQGGIRGPNHNWRSSVLLGGNKRQSWLKLVTPGHCTSDSPILSRVYRLNAHREWQITERRSTVFNLSLLSQWIWGSDEMACVSVCAVLHNDCLMSLCNEQQMDGSCL